MKNCPVCNSLLIEDLVDIKKNIMGKEITIQKVESFRCVSCDYVELDQQSEEFVKSFVKKHIIQEQLKLHDQKRNTMEAMLINKVKKVRLSKNLSQKSVGATLGFTEQRFGQVERNDNTPTIFLALQIAHVLDVQIQDLYEVVYIPKELFKEFQIMNKKLQVIPRLQELRLLHENKENNPEYIKKIQEYRTLNAKFKEALKEYEETYDIKIKKVTPKDADKESDPAKKKLLLSIIEIDKKRKSLGEELKKYREEKSAIWQEIKQLEKSEDILLKQGYCMDYDDWEKIKLEYNSILTKNQ